MRTKKTIQNIIASLLAQVVTIISGFIIPRLIISTYGSSVNGLLASITQMLGFIVLIEGGICGVVRASLYKPLSLNDSMKISKIIKSSSVFFKNIAYFSLLYTAILIIVFPTIVGEQFGKSFLTTLILITSLSTVSQYFISISYQLLLQADQKLYIASYFNIAQSILTLISVVILVKLDSSFTVLRLFSAIIVIGIAIIKSKFVRQKYKIIKNCQYDKTLLKQKWDGLGHHIAYFVNDSTDIVLLTLFTNVKEVSVYSIYYMIVGSIRTLTTTFSSGIEAAFGNMIAKEENELLKNRFNIFEIVTLGIITIMFTMTSILIMKFIPIYLYNINDANYYRPMFAYLLISAGASYCIRLPYHSLVIAAGHFKETRNGAFAEVIINLILSLLLVTQFGLIGVAIGTFVATTFRTLQYVYYLSSNIIYRDVMTFFKRIAVSLFSCVIIILLARVIPLQSITNYYQWIIYAIIIGGISLITTAIISTIFYLKEIKELILILKQILF